MKYRGKKVNARFIKTQAPRGERPGRTKPYFVPAPRPDNKAVPHKPPKGLRP